MDQNEAFFERALKSASRRIDDVVSNPDFASDYRDHALQMALADDERPFGVVYLESVDLFHSVQAVAGTLKGQRPRATDQASIAFSYLKLAAELYLSDLNYLSSRQEDLYPVGAPLMLMGLTRAMVQGEEGLVAAWSKALCTAVASYGDVIRAVIPDEGLVAHIDLAARCWLENRWARPSELEDSLGPYGQLWTAQSDSDFHLMLRELLVHHFREVSRNQFTPLAGLCYLAWPCEVLAMIPLYKRVRNPGFEVRHDAFPAAWQNPARVATAEVEATSVIRRRAQAFYGMNWVAL